MKYLIDEYAAAALTGIMAGREPRVSGDSRRKLNDLEACSRAFEMAETMVSMSREYKDARNKRYLAES